MTCITALVSDGIGYIAGERGATDGSTILAISEPKVWKHEEYLFGYYGSFAAEKIKYNFLPSPVEDNDLATFMNSTFLEELYDVYESCHINRHEDLEFLVVVQGQIFVHNSEDFSMTQYDTPFLAKGSGGEFAMGSLWTTVQARIEPDKSLELALQVAITYSPSCLGPIDILSSEDK
jgi:ATP-dependent protease HslVU (ClpYQ) peptidase subunit